MIPPGSVSSGRRLIGKQQHKLRSGDLFKPSAGRLSIRSEIRTGPFSFRRFCFFSPRSRHGIFGTLARPSLPFSFCPVAAGEVPRSPERETGQEGGFWRSLRHHLFS